MECWLCMIIWNKFIDYHFIYIWNGMMIIHCTCIFCKLHSVIIFFLKEALREQKSRREHQVTMYRKYRKGDLPDIQIKYSYIIAPLQAVAHVSMQRVIYSVSDMQIIYSYIIAPIQAVVHVSTERAIYQTYRSSISTS